MGIKAIVISMMVVMTFVFILYKPLRKKEKKRTDLEIRYAEALKTKAQNLKEIGIEYYKNLGLSEEKAILEIEKDIQG
jgi:hypothetical protein